MSSFTKITPTSTSTLNTSSINTWDLPKGFVTCHLNIRGISGSNKFLELCETLRVNPADLFSISETFLSPVHVSTAYQIPGYQLFRKDRASKTGGGLLIYVSDKYVTHMRNDLSNTDIGICEALWLQVDFSPGKPRLFCVCYRPPNSPISDMSLLKSNFSLALLEKKETVIMGDFNLDMNKPYDRQRIFDLELIGTKQLIYDVTRPISATVIDHIYVSHNQFIVDSGVIQWSLSDHNIVWCARQHRNMFKKSGSFKWITYRSYKTLDQLAFQHDLLQANLCDCSTANRDVDSAWKDWLNRFTIVLDAHAPIRRKKFSSSAPAWLSGDVISAIQHRNHLHKKACQDSTDQDAWASFRKARNAVRKTVRYARSQYHNSIISDSLSKSPKTAWNEIKKLVHKVSASSPTCLKVNDQSLTSYLSSLMLSINILLQSANQFRVLLLNRLLLMLQPLLCRQLLRIGFSNNWRIFHLAKPLDLMALVVQLSKLLRLLSLFQYPNFLTSVFLLEFILRFSKKLR